MGSPVNQSTMSGRATQRCGEKPNLTSSIQAQLTSCCVLGRKCLNCGEVADSWVIVSLREDWVVTLLPLLN